MVSSQAKREAVTFAIARGHSERQACELIGISRSMLGYCVFRAIVTGHFGIVTDRFGNVTGDFGQS